ncbi:hypothetical protein ABVN80_00790 [Acinetobacter baumannii]
MTQPTLKLLLNEKFPVTIAVGANAQSVAEHAFALMFNVARQVTWLDQRTREGHWDKASANGGSFMAKRWA